MGSGEKRGRDGRREERVGDGWGGETEEMGTRGGEGGEGRRGAEKTSVAKARRTISARPSVMSTSMSAAAGSSGVGGGGEGGGAERVVEWPPGCGGFPHQVIC